MSDMMKNADRYYFPVADLNGAAKPEQTKTIEVTGNGTQTVTPDAGYVLSSVTVNTNVPAPAVPTQEKSVTVVENGVTEVEPDAGNFLTKVSITTNVPGTPTQEKTSDVASNGQTVIAPDSGYVLSKVAVNVNVPAPENNIPAIVGRTITALTAEDLAGATIIGVYALYGCTALTAVTIPATVTAIGEYALQCGSSTAKTTFTMQGTTPPVIQATTFTADNVAAIIVPAGSGDAYKAADGWSALSALISEAAA